MDGELAVGAGDVGVVRMVRGAGLEGRAGEGRGGCGGGKVLRGQNAGREKEGHAGGDDREAQALGSHALWDVCGGWEVAFFFVYRREEGSGCRFQALNAGRWALD